MAGYRQIKNIVSDENPEALFIDGFDKALVGIARRCGQSTIAVYSTKKIIALLMKTSDMSQEEAWEYFDFNIFNAWHGENTPFFLS